MNQQIEHLICEQFSGVVDVVCPEHGLELKRLTALFDAQTLEFQIDLPLGVGWRYEWLEHLPQDFVVANIALECATLQECIELDRLAGLQPRNSELEWDRFDDERRFTLRLSPQCMRLSFRRAGQDRDPLSHSHFYRQISDRWLLPKSIQMKDGGAIHFSPLRIGSGDLEQAGWKISSSAPFGSESRRIESALALAFGSSMDPVLKATPETLTFYGYQRSTPVNTSSMISKNGYRADELLQAILAGCLSLSDADFDRAQIAMRFQMYAKQEKVAEFGYIQAMICVEAMDGERPSTLKDPITAALLGVSNDAAILFNGMRHKLVHGLGGYRSAFQLVMDEKFKGSVPQLESAMRACMSVDGKSLDFTQFWWRLCERLDAFWCAYLQVPKELVALRGARVHLMPPVDLALLVEALQKLNETQRAGESKQIADMRAANERRQEKCRKDKDRLKGNIRALTNRLRERGILSPPDSVSAVEHKGTAEARRASR
jgi:hypothetical protein